MLPRYEGHEGLNRVVRVLRRARGIPTPDLFQVLDEPLPALPQGGVIVKVLYASVDPSMRGWLNAESNYSNVPDGAIMRAHGVGEILASDAPAWPVGTVVYGFLGWAQVAAVPASDLLWPIDTRMAPTTAWLASLGLNGLAAWMGFSSLGRPRAGETVLVSTAAGAVGGVVGQLAAAAGVRAVGITGGADKVQLATEALGYAAAIDYKATPDLSHAIGQACPAGIDIFFDNTGGAIADAVFPHLKVGARVAQCGTASVASWQPVPLGPRRERDVLTKRLSWHGFIVFDYPEKVEQGLAELKALHAQGKLSDRVEVLEGLDEAPGSIARLYRGENRGRLLIRP